MLRKVPATLDPTLALKNTQEPKWVTLECQLVTPMYGGGVAAHTVDEKMPIRVSSIRGQLRFWWRLLATHLWRLGDTNVIRQAEADLWGGIDDNTKASKVFLRVNHIRNQVIAPWAKYNTNPSTGRYKSLPDPEKSWADVPYVLFPAQGKKPDDLKAEAPHALAREGLKFQLQVSFDDVSDTQREQVWEAIRWWSQFGGLGARTRRGLGAVQLTQATGANLPTHLCTSISTEEALQAGCRLLLRTPQNSAYAAWQGAVQKLQAFRQVNVGRPDHSSRSRWPEPDAIRRLKQQNSSKHLPVHKAGNLFPRAAFGLPIIFKFKEDGTKRTDEPAQSSLQPVINANVEDRMASPLILRPFHTKDKKWASAALLLPHAHINNLMLDLSGQDVTYWHPAQAAHVPPIQQHNGTDALTAFMNFFVI